MRRFKCFAAISLFVIVILASFNAFAKDTIYIGLVNNFSDYKSPCGDPMGENFLRSVNMALEDFERDNKAYKDRIKFKKFDYGSSVRNAESITRKAVNSNVVGLVGYPCSSYAILAAPIVNESKVPLITPSATIDRLTDNNDYVFRSCFRDEDQARAVAGYMYDVAAKRNAVIIVNEDYPYSVNLAQKFTKYFEKRGGKVSAVYSTLSSKKSYKDVFVKMAKVDYDVIFIPNHERESAVIVKDLLDNGINTTIAGGDGWGNLYGYIFPKMAGDSHVDAYAVAHWNVESKSRNSLDYKKRYYDTYGELPNDNSALAYDAMSILLLAISKSKAITRDGIRNAMATIKSHDGVTGTYTFDRHEGTPRKDVHIVKYYGKGRRKGHDRPFKVAKSVIY